MSERLVEALKVKSIMSVLVESAGWKALCEVFDEQVHNRRQQYELTPLESLHDVPKAEYAKGEAAALQLAKGLPQAMIDSAQSVIDTEPEEKDEDNGEGKTEY